MSFKPPSYVNIIAPTVQIIDNGAASVKQEIEYRGIITVYMMSGGPTIQKNTFPLLHGLLLCLSREHSRIQSLPLNNLIDIAK